MAEEAVDDGALELQDGRLLCRVCKVAPGPGVDDIVGHLRGHGLRPQKPTVAAALRAWGVGLLRVIAGILLVCSNCKTAVLALAGSIREHLRAKHHVSLTMRHAQEFVTELGVTSAGNPPRFIMLHSHPALGEAIAKGEVTVQSGLFLCRVRGCYTAFSGSGAQEKLHKHYRHYHCLSGGRSAAEVSRDSNQHECEGIHLGRNNFAVLWPATSSEPGFLLDEKDERPRQKEPARVARPPGDGSGMRAQVAFSPPAPIARGSLVNQLAKGADDGLLLPQSVRRTAPRLYHTLGWFTRKEFYLSLCPEGHDAWFGFSNMLEAPGGLAVHELESICGEALEEVTSRVRLLRAADVGALGFIPDGGEGYKDISGARGAAITALQPETRKRYGCILARLLAFFNAKCAAEGSVLAMPSSLRAFSLSDQVYHMFHSIFDAEWDTDTTLGGASGGVRGRMGMFTQYACASGLVSKASGGDGDEGEGIGLASPGVLGGVASALIYILKCTLLFVRFDAQQGGARLSVRAQRALSTTFQQSTSQASLCYLKRLCDEEIGLESTESVIVDITESLARGITVLSVVRPGEPPLQVSKVTIRRALVGAGARAQDCIRDILRTLGVDGEMVRALDSSGGRMQFVCGRHKLTESFRVLEADHESRGYTSEEIREALLVGWGGLGDAQQRKVVDVLQILQQCVLLLMHVGTAGSLRADDIRLLSSVSPPHEEFRRVECIENGGTDKDLYFVDVLTPTQLLVVGGNHKRRREGLGADDAVEMSLSYFVSHILTVFVAIWSVTVGDSSGFPSIWMPKMAGSVDILRTAWQQATSLHFGHRITFRQWRMAYQLLVGG